MITNKEETNSNFESEFTLLYKSFNELIKNTNFLQATTVDAKIIKLQLMHSKIFIRKLKSD